MDLLPTFQTTQHLRILRGLSLLSSQSKIHPSAGFSGPTPMRMAQNQRSPKNKKKNEKKKIPFLFFQITLLFLTSNLTNRKPPTANPLRIAKKVINRETCQKIAENVEIPRETMSQKTQLLSNSWCMWCGVCVCVCVCSGWRWCK